MAFRFLLVGAVAALGFDLPQGIDVDAWTQSGRAWWHARVAEFEARHGIALARIEGDASPETEPVVAVEPSAPDADAAFATVMEDVIAAFASDGSSESIAEPEARVQLVAGVAEPTFGPEFADSLNRWADGLSEPAEPAPLAPGAGVPWLATDPGIDPNVAPNAGSAGPALATAIGLETDGEIDAPSSPEASARGEEPEGASPASSGLRFVQAVRLTGQALQAWLALVQPTEPLAL
ncbi:hypothetical protein [Tautonia sociabilis]|uniref:Uncharacterized protein n=1 Tax=Tautonia sociabilis TaxID=2080755 RepID=A0A432MNC7_9BACT|nr:hypothetical protein [Tautonia sociabilis]RUL88943.1 hypothetical protein TsocGM_04935 [Tautonia sociabilis]